MLLNVFVLKNLKEVGRHTDDQTKGLHLWIKANQRKYWIFRFTFQSRRYNISLGGFPEIGLGQARERAVEARNLLNKGCNPIDEKKTSKALISNRCTSHIRPLFNWVVRFEMVFLDGVRIAD